MDLFDLFVKLGVDDTDFVEKISDIGNKVSTFSTSIVSGMSVAVTAIKNVGTAIVDNVSQLAAYGDGIDKASQKMGMSIEAYQEWDAVMQHSGTSIDSVKSSMRALNSAVSSGSDAFQELGISEDKVAEMSKEELFSATIEALQKVDDESERTRLANKLLGRGAVELGALLNTSAEDTQAMKDRVHELGGVMSEEAVKSSALFQDNLQDMQTAISGIGRGIYEEFLPSLNSLMAGFTSLIIGEEGAEEQLSQGFDEFAKSVENIAQKIEPIINQLVPRIVDFIVDSLPLIADSALSILNTLAQSIFDNIDKVISIGIKLIKNIIKGLTDNLPMVIDAALRIIRELGDTLMGNISDVVKMGLDLIKGVISGIVDNLPLFIEVAADIIYTLVDDVLTHLPEILDLALDIIMTLVDGLTGDNLSKMADAAITLIVKVLDTLTENLPEFYEKGYEVLGKLIAGLIEQAPTIIQTAIDTITKLICQLAFNFDWIQIGKDILKGIADGIMAGITAIDDAITSAGEEIANGFKDFFGIASPSKLMREKIGRFIPQGIAEGIENSKDYVNKAIEKVTKSAEKPIKLNTNIDTNVSTNAVTGFKAAKAKSSFVSGQKPIVININGIQYQNIEQLTTAIADTLQSLTIREAVGYGV